MPIRITPGCVPPGNYLARFAGAEQVENQFGLGLRWKFVVKGGTHDGSPVSRTTGTNGKLKTKCADIIAGLAGEPLTPGTLVDEQNFVGKDYLIVVSDTGNGGSKVESVTPAPPK